MIKLSETGKQLIKVMLSLDLVCFGIGIIVTALWFPNEVAKFTYGVVFGGVFSILKLLLLERTLSKSVDLSGGRAKAQNYVRLHYMIRYFLTGAVLVVAATIGISAIIGVFICLVTLRPATHIVNYKLKDRETKSDI